MSPPRGRDTESAGPGREPGSVVPVRSDVLLRHLLASSTDIIFTLGEDGRIESANPAFERILGIRRADWIGRDYRPLVLPQDVPAAMDALARALAGESVGTFELRLAVNGRELVLECAISGILEPGEPPQVLGIARDVTARRRSEDALREQEQRYRELFESSFDMLYTHDLEGRVLSLSPSGERLLGAPLDELVGRVVWHRIAPESREASKHLLEEMLRTKKPVSYEFEIVRPDGKRVPVEGTTWPVVRQGEIVSFQGSVRDLSRRVALESQLSQARKMEAVGTLAGGVAHDFNNMLTVILGYARLALGTLPADAETRPYFDGIHKTGERAAMLTRQLLAFARKQVLKREGLDLNRVAHEFSPLLRRLLGERIALELDLAPGVAGVRGDRSQLEQVLLNLCVNARDAIDETGQVVISTRLVTVAGENADALAPGSYVRWTVRDDGSGIPREIQPKIFEPFFTTKRVGQGSGLGLALVYGVVRQHEGQIQCESTVGKGTEFVIHLPATQEVAVAPEVAEATGDYRGDETILVVEDETLVRELVSAVLGPLGYRLLVADDGEAALAIYDVEGGRIDLVVADIVMPRMGGPELAEHVRERGNPPPFLFMSGYASAAVREDEIVARGHDFLEKPFEVFAFAKRVREILDRRREPRV